MFQKKSLILIIIILFSITLIGQTKIDFCEKWYLDGYLYWGITYSPNTIEKNDYIILVLQLKDEKGSIKIKYKLNE